MQNLKTISIPSLKLSTGEREFALYGGTLYMNGSPVQSFFSKDSFYWEQEEEQGIICLRHFGLMAEVYILRNGIQTEYKAGSEIHYNISYTGSEAAQLDVCFGVAFDKDKRMHYYCGLTYNGVEIIPVPQTDEEKQNQRVLSVTITEKELLHISMDTSGYQTTISCFPITKLEMTFDAAYNTCDAIITEGTYDLNQYSADAIESTIAGDKIARGDSVIHYTDEAKQTHTLQIQVDSMTEKEKVFYYCGLNYDGQKIIAMPMSPVEQQNQSYISCYKMNEKWNLSLQGIEDEKKKFYVQSLLVRGNNAATTKIMENKSKLIQYSAKGTIKNTALLKEKQRLYRADALTMERLKENYLKSELNILRLSVDELFHISPPPSMTITDTTDPTKTIVLDGQSYCHQKSIEVLKYLAAYYTADTKSSDGHLTYADLYNFTKDYALTKINEVSPDIITDIEKEKDDKDKQYVVEFLKKYSDIILSSSLAGNSNEYIQKGYSDVKDPVARCQYYLSDNHDGSLQHEKGYQFVIKLVDKYQYIALVPKLSDYVKNNSESWAEELYYSAVEKIVMIQFQCIGDNNKATHIAKMLAILDDKNHQILDKIGGKPIKDDNGNEVCMPYAAALYAQILNLSLSSIGNTFKGITDMEEYIKIMTVFFGDLYDKVSVGDTADLPEELVNQLKEWVKDGRDVFIENQIIELQDMMQFTTATGDFMSALAKYGAGTKTIGKLNGCLMYVFMGVSFASVFGQWSELTVAEKAQSIMVGLYAVLGTVREISAWVNVSKFLDPTASITERTQAAYRLKFGGADFDRIQDAVPHNTEEPYVLSERLQETSEQYSMSIHDAAGAEVKLSGFSKFFVGVELTFQLLNVALMGFAFIMASINLATLFKNDYSTALRTVEIINTILLGISFILGVASFVLSFTSLATTTAVASVFPIVGGICMFISFAFSIAAMFLQPKNPKPSIQLIIEEHLVTTVKALAEATAEWKHKTYPNNCLEDSQLIAVTVC